MAVYKYKVVDAGGKNKKGEIEAQSQEQAVSKLKADGFTVVSCNEAGAMDKDINLNIQKKMKDLFQYTILSQCLQAKTWINLKTIKAM